MDYIKFLSETYDFCFLFLAYMTAFLLQINLLMKCLNVKVKEKLSANITINVLLWVIVTFLGQVYVGFLLWTFGEEKSGYVLFWFGAILGGFGLALSSSIMFLMLDRIFALTQPIYYNKYRREFISLTILSCLLFFISYISALIIYEWPLDVITSCKIFLCVTARNGGFSISVLKIFAGTMNVIVSIAFYITLCRYIRSSSFSSSKFKNANRLVAVAIISEILFNFFPNFTLIILSLQKIAISKAYALVVNAIYTIGTAFIYRILINPQKQTRTQAINNSSRPLAITNTTVFR